MATDLSSEFVPSIRQRREQVGITDQHLAEAVQKLAKGERLHRHCASCLYARCELTGGSDFELRIRITRPLHVGVPLLLAEEFLTPRHAAEALYSGSGLRVDRSLTVQPWVNVHWRCQDIRTGTWLPGSQETTHVA